LQAAGTNPPCPATGAGADSQQGDHVLPASRFTGNIGRLHKLVHMFALAVGAVLPS